MPSIDNWIYILYDTFRMEGITLHSSDTSPLFRLRWRTLSRQPYHTSCAYILQLVQHILGVFLVSKQTYGCVFMMDIADHFIHSTPNMRILSVRCQHPAPAATEHLHAPHTETAPPSPSFDSEAHLTAFNLCHSQRGK